MIPITNTDMRMNYTAPETDVIMLRLEENLLTVSTGASTGENVTIDSEYDPW